MSSGEICAVIYGGHESWRIAELTAAVLGQTTAVTRLVAPATPGGPPSAPAGVSVTEYVHEPGSDALRAGVEVALSGPADWLWLLECSTTPQPGALAELLAVGDATEPSPVLLASKVLGPDGQLHPDGLPRHEVFEKERTIEAAAHHLVHLRAAVPGSVLVLRQALSGLSPLPTRAGSRAGMLGWSARLLRDRNRDGYLVPGSVAVRHSAPQGPDWDELRQRAATLAGDAWTPSEKLWESFLLGAEAVRQLQSARARTH
jgi:hypothetical protein